MFFKNALEHINKNFAANETRAFAILNNIHEGARFAR